MNPNTTTLSPYALALHSLILEGQSNIAREALRIELIRQFPVNRPDILILKPEPHDGLHQQIICRNLNDPKNFSIKHAETI